MFKLGSRSLKHLEGVNKNLASVVHEAIKLTEVDFSVVDGLRTVEEQRQLVKEGRSKTMNSRHLKGTAVDIYPWVNGKTSHAAAHYAEIAKAMFAAAANLNIELEWGGEWKTFVDKPHWQLKE